MLQSPDIKIVIIEDDEDDYFLIADYIKEIEGPRWIIDWCNNYDTALQKIQHRDYDIYFVDYRLGSRTGLELLQEVAENLEDPIILLTGKGNKDIDIQAMKYGATDYLVKSELNTEKLERCIRYALDRAADLRELKARESKYRNLFDGSRDALFITDENLRIAEVNEAARGLFLEKEHKEGRTLYDIIQEQSIRKEIQTRLQEKRPVDRFELEIKTPDGQLMSCLLSLSFLETQKPEQVLHGILHDITKIKRAEIVNLQAQKMALNEHLMQTLAHEIRNPLNNISLALQHFDVSDDQSTLLGIMDRNTDRINHILTELLDLTKPLELTFHECGLQEILDESLSMILDRLQLQNILVEKSYPDTPLKITANRSKLVIAFTNILVNAVEAMESGKGTLWVDLEVSDGRYIVSIRDNGMGIPEEYLPKLFEPFFTLKKSGVGLGLSSSFSIFKSHKADVKVESRVNEGTNFLISFDAS